MGGYYGYGNSHLYILLFLITCSTFSLCVCALENVDKYARDMIDMSRERRLRDGQDLGSLKDSTEALSYTKVRHKGI